MRLAGWITGGAIAALLLAAPAGGQAPQSGVVFRSNPAGTYEYGTEVVEGVDGNSTFIRSLGGGEAAWLTSWLDAKQFQGKRVRLTARLKLDGANGATRASCSLGAWDANRVLGGGNGPRLYGNQDWTECSVTALIPENATRVELRFALVGSGKVWSDGFRVAPAE